MASFYLISNRCSGFRSICFLAAAEQVFQLAVFQNDKDRGSVENGRISTTENTNQQDGGKLADSDTAKQGQGGRADHYGKLGVDLASQSLDNGMVHDFLERQPAVNG